MADIWMDVDAALSEVPVNILPLLDDTDFKTIEASVAYNASGMDLRWNFVDTAGSYTSTAVTPTSSGAHDWNHQGDGMYSLEIPASAGTINNDTEGFGWFSGVVTGVLPFRGPIIGFRAAALNNSLIDAGTTGLLAPATAGRTLVVDAAGLADANVVKVGPTGSGTAQTAGDIMADTNDIQTRLPAALVSGRMDSSVGAMAANVITATAINADAITASKIADGAIDAATFAAGAIDAAAIAADAIGSSELAATAVNEIADQVWDEVLSGHLTSGTTGAALNASGSAGDPWATTLPGAYEAGTAGKIVGDNINATISSRATQTSVDTIDDFLDTEIAAIKAKTDNLPSDPADASDIASSFTTVNTKLDTIDDFLDTEIAAIKAKTDNLPSDPADASDIASSFSTVNSTLATIASYIDTEVAAIKAKTDLIPASPAAVGDIPSVASIADGVWDEISSGHTTAGSYGYKIGAHKDAVLVALTTSGGSATTIPLNTSTGIDGGVPSAVDDFYNGRAFVFISGALAGQAVRITDYVGSTKILTVSSMTGTPASGVTGVIV